ncbi:MAG TPA: DNA polymerase III subunit alpha [Candidatus Baltobacteraceae bacterium]|nr:DNA polymerase III subunit alpha [Candidatus Baltobacteraceae bacterium]
MAGYAELHAHSNFTFLEGGSHPEELVEVAAQLGLGALALTDRNGLYGSVRFSRAAAEVKLPGIIGSELTFADGAAPIVALAEDERGYANLSQIISAGQLRGAKNEPQLHESDLDGRSDGLIVLTAESGVERLSRLRERFGDRLYLEMQHHLHAQDARTCRVLAERSAELDIPLVATNGVMYALKEHGRLADVLFCIKNRTNLQQAREDALLRPNSEYHLKTPRMMAQIFSAYPQAVKNTLVIAERCAFRLDKLAGQFPVFPVPDGYTRQSYLRDLVYRGAAERYGTPIATNVERQLEYELGMIARMDLAGYFLIVWDIVRAAQELRVLCQGRGSAANSAVCYALGITAVDPIGMNLLFERFMSEGREEIPDIDIDFAHQDREKVIQYVYDRYGRTHAAMAAEVITYHARSAIRDIGKAIGLTLAQVDAVAKDFDARESLTGALGVEETQCHPEVSKDPEVSKGRIDPPPERGKPRTPRLGHAHDYHGFHGRDYGDNPDPHIKPSVDGPIGELLFALCRRIDGFPRHMGIHSGGMVITRDPLVRVAPIEWATMRDRTIVQWDKDDLQELGLIKIDLLGLGMLSLLREAFALHARCTHRGDEWIRTLDARLSEADLGHPDRLASSIASAASTTRHGQMERVRLEPDDGVAAQALAPTLQLHTIPADDEATYEMISKADTIGVFQIESRAQQSMLPRMKPNCFYDIVMQVAIIRPGPIQGQMIHPFLRRRSGLEPVTYPHPKLKPVLERTLGVPLFQEQGMRMAIEAAGFSPAEADKLRRAMGHKRSRERMLEIQPKLVNGMVENGIDRAAAEQLFHMLEGFADYGFPESHAASFALLAYESAYLKCHYPALFAAAILNVQPMGFYSTEVLVNDARRHGVKVKPMTVNASEYYSFVEPDGSLRLGFHLLRGLGEGQKERLEAAVAQGPFDDLLTFAQRTQLEKEAMENLAVAGAFTPWFKTRRDAMWALRGLDERETRGELGRMMDVHEPSAAFKKISNRQETSFDLWSTGVTPKEQPMTHFRKFLDDQRVLAAAKLREAPNHLVCRVGGLVITRQRPGTAKGFVFLTLEDETGLVNVIVRPDIYEKYRRVIRQSMTVIVEGQLQKEAGCIDWLARKVWAFDAEEVVGGVRSRNFQ